MTGGVGYGYLNKAELYDLSTETWTITASMNSGREEHTTSLLRNGKVLVTAGHDGPTLNNTELFTQSAEISITAANV